MSARLNAQKRGDLRGIFIFALLAAFALLSLVVVIVGARSYRAINTTAEQAYVSRTGLSYLISKVRGADEAGQIEIRNADGQSVLTLGQEIDGERYATYIYCDGTQVREYFAQADRAFSPEYGESIFQASALHVTLDQSLLTIEIVDETGKTHTTSLYLQAAKEGGA
ncbi:MAG: DUF4860 domain-containing protein [Eubacteriales bacterium]|nr:DUF4860 domain-containing protein [Eubacteriales bacterium]